MVADLTDDNFPLEMMYTLQNSGVSLDMEVAKSALLNLAKPPLEVAPITKLSIKLCLTYWQRALATSVSSSKTSLTCMDLRVQKQRKGRNNSLV